MEQIVGEILGRRIQTVWQTVDGGGGGGAFIDYYLVSHCAPRNGPNVLKAHAVKTAAH